MPPPSKVAIATGSVLRLVKEEASYHKEIVQQEERIKKLEESTAEDSNKEYTLKQERQALAETKNVLPSMQTKISAALEKLEDVLEANKEGGADASTEDVTKAKEAVAQGKAALRQAS